MSDCSELYFDGASKGNPGPSGCGWYIKSGGTETPLKGYKYLDITTNNVAEYSGLIEGLKHIGNSEHLKIYGDSKLVIEQMKGTYKVKAPHLIPLWREAQNIVKKIKKVEFIHIDRSLNAIADQLANFAVMNKDCDE